MTVTTESANWHVAVKDAIESPKPAGSGGKMAEYDTRDSKFVSGGNVFTNAMNVSGTTIGNAIGYSVNLTALDLTIETGTGSVHDLVIPVKFSQLVSYADPHLSGEYVYRILVTFTGLETP